MYEPIRSVMAQPERVASQDRIVIEDDRTSNEPVALRRAFYDHLRYSKARHLASATPYDRFYALALTVRDRLVFRWSQTQ